MKHNHETIALELKTPNHDCDLFKHYFLSVL